MKKLLKKRFKTSFPGKRLLAIQLDGFSHRVIYDGGRASDPVQKKEFSGCMPEGNFDNGARYLFEGIGHNQYQNNAKEIIYILPKER